MKKTRFENEIWKSIPGWEGHYEASNLGRIRGLPSKLRPRRHQGGILKPCPMARGGYKKNYATVLLTRGGRKLRTTVNRLVLSAFTGENRPGKDAAHRNGTASDNRIENLYWATRKENEKDKIAHGTLLRGEASCRSKITEVQAKAMLSSLRKGTRICDVAREFKVTYAIAYAIKHRQAWSHLTPTESGD